MNGYPTHVQWEYAYSHEYDIESLNAHGRDGWELVQADTEGAIFKREILQEPQPAPSRTLGANWEGS